MLIRLSAKPKNNNPDLYRTGLNADALSGRKIAAKLREFFVRGRVVGEKCSLARCILIEIRLEAGVCLENRVGREGDQICRVHFPAKAEIGVIEAQPVGGPRFPTGHPVRSAGHPRSAVRRTRVLRGPSLTGAVRHSARALLKCAAERVRAGKCDNLSITHAVVLSEHVTQMRGRLVLGVSIGQAKGSDGLIGRGICVNTPVTHIDLRAARKFD
mmetsp:Transcript_41497/g.102870  ORF Transcript_41497/g.102870 Transcript_41497/m.102870 type:complete len:214 (-) Transcript_41497:454-1095(-)